MTISSFVENLWGAEAKLGFSLSEIAGLFQLHWPKLLPIFISIGVCLVIEIIFLPLKENSVVRLLRTTKPFGMTRFGVLLSLFPALAFLIGDLLSLGTAGLLHRYAMNCAVPFSFDLAGYCGPFFAGLIYILIYDLFRYLKHMLCHEVPFFWEIHRMHHIPKTFHIFNADLKHPFESVSHYVVSTLLLFLFQIRAEEAILAFSFRLILIQMHHSPLIVSYGWLEKIFVSPRFHAIHHLGAKAERAWNTRNYGSLFSFWDYLFGTADEARGRIIKNADLGIRTNVDESDLKFFLFHPLIKFYELLFKKASLERQ